VPRAAPRSPTAPSRLRVVAGEVRVEERVFALVYRQMRAFAGRSADEDDLIQVAAEQALRGLARFETRSDVSTWTYRICYHTWLKHRRWYRRWLRRFAYSRDGELPERADPGPNAADALVAQERRRRLGEALARVSPKRRAVVILHDLEGLDVEQIAGVVGANPRTVRSRLRDGRARLAAELRQDSYFGDRACSETEDQ